MAELPNIGEPFGEVIGGKVYINPAWYEALKLTPYIMPSKSQLDLINDPSVAYNSIDTAQNNARNAHQRVGLTVSFLRTLMLSLEDAGVYPGWSDS